MVEPRLQAVDRELRERQVLRGTTRSDTGCSRRRAGESPARSFHRRITRPHPQPKSSTRAGVLDRRAVAREHLHGSGIDDQRTALDEPLVEAMRRREAGHQADHLRRRIRQPVDRRARRAARRARRARRSAHTCGSCATTRNAPGRRRVVRRRDDCMSSAPRVTRPRRASSSTHSGSRLARERRFRSVSPNGTARRSTSATPRRPAAARSTRGRPALGHLDAGERFHQEPEHRPGAARRSQSRAARRARSRPSQQQRPDHDQQREQRLEAEHRPVARAPHADRHRSHQRGVGERAGVARSLPWTSTPARTARSSTPPCPSRSPPRSSRPAAARPRSSGTSPRARCRPCCASGSCAPAAAAGGALGRRSLRAGACARAWPSRARQPIRARRRRARPRCGRASRAPPRRIVGVADRAHDGHALGAGVDDRRRRCRRRCRRSRRTAPCACSAA